MLTIASASIIKLSCIVGLLWAVVHIVAWLYRRGTRDHKLSQHDGGARKSLDDSTSLPLHYPLDKNSKRTSRYSRSPDRGDTTHQGVCLSLGPLWLSVDIPGESRYLHALNRIPRGKSAKTIYTRLLTIATEYIYDFGTLISLILFFTILPFFFYLVIKAAFSTTGSDVTSFTPRLIQDSDASVVGSGLLIPGVTTPMRDLPIMLVASFIAILWHELGHAMSAIL